MKMNAFLIFGLFVIWNYSPSAMCICVNDVSNQSIVCHLSPEIAQIAIAVHLIK